MSGSIATPKFTMGHKPQPPAPEDAVGRLLDRLNDEIRDGIRHGYFKYEITGGDATGGYTEVILYAGKKHRFLIPKK